MEKQIRNAGKRNARPRKGRGKALPALPHGPKGKGNTLRALHSGTGTLEQRTPKAALGNGKTFEVINGTPCFFIVIPCSTGNPDRRKPLYLVTENNLGGPERGVWQCQECGAIRYTRKAWAKHAGMISNIMGTCPGAEG